jgi:hypothetical protein
MTVKIGGHLLLAPASTAARAVATMLSLVLVWLPAPTGSGGFLSTSSGNQHRDQAPDDRSGEESDEDREDNGQDV